MAGLLWVAFVCRSVPSDFYAAGSAWAGLRTFRGRPSIISFTQLNISWVTMAGKAPGTRSPIWEAVSWPGP